MIRFVEIKPYNEQLVSEIFAGEVEQYWVHYNNYWLENSRRLPDVQSYLIYALSTGVPVGFIAFGQHYQDEELTQPVVGTMEIIHTVIHKPHQFQGYGRVATLEAIQRLLNIPGCKEIVIAHNPANLVARRLYDSLGFVEYAQNYDGDPLMRLRHLKEYR